VEERREIREVGVPHASGRHLIGEAEMVAVPEVMSQVVPMLESSFHRCPVKGVEEVVVVGAAVSPPPAAVASPEADSPGDLEVPDLVSS
jgi:hypothetical protein